MFTFDTNILIYLAAGDPKVLNFWTEHRSEIFYVPSIVIAEFLSYPLITSAAAEKFHDFIRQTIIVNLDYPIAAQAALIRRETKLSLADAAVAASSMMTHSSLLTRNIRDFKKVPYLDIIPL
ncbi:MAG: type II toxin-antitoxin system VapC family toxin [Patescibacteria group bacterium]